ncbi:hypothetical protein, partial [Alistipes finegoldii]|uniref:hypothetical protein n=1 Tax=Alistipes finegoldii TaxID=214856 RepID=UPI003AB17EA2
MRKYMMLLGKESFWLLGVAAIAFCVGIIISVDWLTNICWSIVAATIVYGVTVVLSRYSERKYRSIFLRKYVSALLEVGVNLFQNITSKNLLAELNYKRFMFKKLCILLIFSKLNEIKHLIDKYRMHN